MKKINLHTHSKHSLDGNLDINGIILECFTNGIFYLSITDHDNCDAYSDLDLDKININGTLVYGMEADAIINDVTYDILCYGFTLDKVSAWAKEQYGTIASRQMKIYTKLVEVCKSLNLALDDSNPYDPEKEFAHAAVFRMLENTNENQKFLNKYNISNINDFYRLSTMDNNFPLYISMNIVWPTIDVLGKIIHANGGKIFLAHPYKYIKGKNVDEILDSCMQYIDGIEICNESENEEQVIHLYNYAKQNNLLISAGSDFHASKKHNDINVDYLSEEMSKDIESWINEVPGKIRILKNK